MPPRPARKRGRPWRRGAARVILLAAAPGEGSATERSLTSPHDDPKWLAQMRRGSLELCVLAILARGKRYGYDIVQALSNAEGMVIKEGTIYPLLNRLRSDGLVEAEWEASPHGPARKYYTLTPDGTRKLALLRSEWRRFKTGVDRLVEGEEQS